MAYLLETKNLSKIYKDVVAVDKINLQLPQNAVYGLIGRNGAGKTTILKMLSGLIHPTEGEIKYNSQIIKNRFGNIGTLIESPGLFRNMTGFENLKIKSFLTDKKYSNEDIRDLLKLVGLNNVAKQKVKNYSLGMKQRLGIALALVGDPEVLILDEPINGLDPQGIIEIRNIIKKLHEKKDITIIISSHILDELFKIATNFCIIHNGKIIVQKTKEELIEECGETPIDEYYLKIIGGVE